MKYVLVYLGSALIAIFTTICGWGWFNNGFNPKGAFLNIILVLFWVTLCNILIKDKDK
jgi:hypothetical protein